MSDRTKWAVHDRVNGVKNTSIKNPRQIGKIITLIQSQLDAPSND